MRRATIGRPRSTDPLASFSASLRGDEIHWLHREAGRQNSTAAGVLRALVEQAMAGLSCVRDLRIDRLSGNHHEVSIVLADGRKLTGIVPAPGMLESA